MPAAKTLSTLRTYASFVKLSHTVFALPFAVAAFVAALAAPLRVTVIREYGDAPFEHAVQVIEHVSPSWLVAALCLLCMISARSFAMAFNRVADRKFDALNPRTLSRELPAGRLSVGQARVFAAAMAALYFGACALLGPVVLTLSIIPIALMVFYSYTKRFTWLCHVVLGSSLGLAPVGVWVAARSGGWGTVLAESATITVDRWLGTRFLSLVSARVAGPSESFSSWLSLADWLPWLLGASVMLWVAGFDVIYALQDDEFDRQQGLKSIPARFGRKNALRIAGWMHFGSLVCLMYAGGRFAVHCGELNLLAGLERPATAHAATVGGVFISIALFAFLIGLIRQHAIVKPHDLSRVNAAFFTVNGVISIIVGLAFLAAYLAAIWL